MSVYFTYSRALFVLCNQSYCFADVAVAVLDCFSKFPNVDDGKDEDDSNNDHDDDEIDGDYDHSEDEDEDEDVGNGNRRTRR